ncbi:hypothetical protein C2845_PM03G13390 [Panicum miliaceum]|uniref:Uncharacterized protein n=1 Tax=Panicum miliaceum TaxID=4540 RepID=A0A3L6T636_PANMI|nr:hypothetical protein C2845_PM03G13390 [Panicum miliaceum]
MPPSFRARALSTVVSAPGPSSSAASRLHRMWDEFALLVRLHGNQIALLGFVSLGLGLGGGEGRGGNAGGGGGADVDGVGEVDKAVTRAKAPKKVLILMSDAGGVHRASAEAIKPPSSRSSATITRDDKAGSSVRDAQESSTTTTSSSLEEVDHAGPCSTTSSSSIWLRRADKESYLMETRRHIQAICIA